MLKRAVDFCISLSVLFFFSWLLLVCWLAAIYDTKTNGIFKQVRVGQFGKPFHIYKFRTIQISNDHSAFNISRIGEFLRRYKLDELPQFFNIIKGEMALVGPRPDIRSYYDSLKGENRKILELKPGLTSIAALKYWNENDLLRHHQNPKNFNDSVLFPDKVKLNLEYYYKQSILLDVKILFKTIQRYF